MKWRTSEIRIFCGRERPRAKAEETVWFLEESKVWGGIHNQLAEELQPLGPIAHKAVLARLNIDCESFRGELETQLSWVGDIQMELVQGGIN